MVEVENSKYEQLLQIIKSKKFQSEGCEFCGGGEGYRYIPEEKYEELAKEIVEFIYK